MKRITVMIVGVLFLFTGTQLGFAFNQEKIKAPEFELTAINKARDNSCIIGKALKQKDFTVILFWTTWCPHCARALQEINDYQQKYSDKIKFCAIALEKDVNKVKNYVVTRDITVPVGVDTDGMIGYMYGVRGVPTVVVIDKGGYVFDYGFSLEWIMRRVLEAIEGDRKTK